MEDGSSPAGSLGKLHGDTCSQSRCYCPLFYELASGLLKLHVNTGSPLSRRVLLHDHSIKPPTAIHCSIDL